MRSLLDLIARRTSAPTLLNVNVEGRSLDVLLKRNARARRMTLRLTRDGESATLNLPGRTSVTEAKAFLQRSTPWLAKQIVKQPPRVAFGDGAEIPLRGVPHVIVATSGSRGLISLDDHKLLVPGASEHLSRRLTDWLKRQAAADLEKACVHYTAVMGVTFKRITIRDQKSRWGSCSSAGMLSFSWRLILAPPMVLDYVAAHEVAHLLEMNHSPSFWRHVLKHCPHARAAKNWMNAHGGELHRFG
jgi:predicted metal-dependent hydrolase